MIQEFLLVGSGSFFGGMARYGISLIFKGGGSVFPWATFLANVIGCFLIGLICAVFGRQSDMSANVYLFLTTGFCGGFTTFSTFSKESLLLLQSGDYRYFFLYFLGSVLLGLLAVLAGYSAMK